MTATETITRNCGKCNGSGYIRAYASIANGVCFSCSGTGTHTTTVAAEKRRKAAEARREAQRSAKTEEFVLNYMREAKAAGLTAQECHDERCSCGEFCWATSRPQSLEKWERV